MEKLTLWLYFSSGREISDRGKEAFETFHLVSCLVVSYSGLYNCKALESDPTGIKTTHEGVMAVILKHIDTTQFCHLT